MIPQITLVILVGFLFVVQGFVVSPGTEIWRRQSFGSTSSTSSTPTIISSTSRIRGCWSNGNPRVGHTRPGYVRMSVNDMLGADVESNGIFDPLGVSADEPSLFRRRADGVQPRVQVAMVAMLGILVQSFMRFPGFPPFPVVSTVRPLAVMKGLWAFERNAVLVVLLAIGVVELTIGRQNYVDKAPGELGNFGALAKPVDEEEWENIQLAEIKHGRLAMLAVVGALAQEMVTGEGPVEQLFTGNVNPFA
ncbi:unnamed protein product [Ascophyllum nodosum]